MKGTKYMSMGGAAQAEMQANPGMSNMPKSVMSALMGQGTRAAGSKPMLKGTKGMAQGGAMKGTKGMAKGGGMAKGVKGFFTGGIAKQEPLVESKPKPRRPRNPQTGSKGAYKYGKSRRGGLYGK